MLVQDVPEELYNMADRYKRMKARKEEERRSGGGDRNRGGFLDRDFGSFGSFGGGRRGRGGRRDGGGGFGDLIPSF